LAPISSVADGSGPSVADRPAVPVGASGGHRARWIALAVLVIAAGLTAVLAASPSATVAQVQSTLVGHQAPTISGPTIDGTQFSLPKAPGKFVVLNFFASWCVPCQSEGPDLVKFQFQHQASGDATMVSVVFDDTVSAARAYQQDTLGATWPTLTDPGGTLALNYGVAGQPTTFIIAPDGKVVAHIVSPVTAGELDALIASAKANGA
jgi:cytochrome c biogenesis protein CcmG/thiol:disulfide interchange protein DsbE